MKKIKNKKTLIILLVLLIGVIGITIAYFSNSTVLDNLFSTKPYGTTYIETFVSPDNWLPGDTIDKTLVVTNSGEVDEAVRISYTEEWKSNNGTTLSGLIDEFGKLTDEEENSDKAAIINFSNTDDWTYNNGYYYYNYRLKPNETTSSFIESVTFNPKVTLGNTCTETESNGKKTITCNSGGEDYDNATYKLTLTIETVQYNKYMSAWSTDVAIANEQLLFCDSFEVGEVVDYNGSEYYVLKDSSTSDDYVTLLKKDPLTAEEVNQYSTSYVSQDGEYPYYESDACNDNDQTGCSTNYDISDVKKVVDGWSSSFSDDLVEIDGYKTRLIGEDEVAFESYATASSVGYYLSQDTPNFIKLNNYYWTLVQINDSNSTILGINNKTLFENSIYNKLYIRPVINLKKNVLNACSNTKYNIGDEIVCYDDLYNVIEDRQNFLVLLKNEPLNATEVNLNSTSNYKSFLGEHPFNSSNSAIYDNSDIKIIIDNWADNFDDDLIYDYSNYKVRLINNRDLLRFGYVNEQPTENTPTWVYDYSTWTMLRTPTPEIAKYIVNNDGNIKWSSPSGSSVDIRPVINLKKSVIENVCQLVDSYKSYSIGELVNYNNTNYCVISNSSIKQDYVTVIKQEPLTYDELVTYNNGHDIERDNTDNNIGIMSYYKSDDCYYNSESDKNLTGCLNNYNNSFVKNIVDNWSNSFNDDLKKVDGYKTRLITTDELKKMGHIFYHGTAHPLSEQKSEYTCLYGDADYWSMDSMYDYSYYIDVVSKVDSKNGARLVDHQYAVRPVINLKKCAIDNTCE